MGLRIWSLGYNYAVFLTLSSVIGRAKAWKVRVLCGKMAEKSAPIGQRRTGRRKKETASLRVAVIAWKKTGLKRT